MRVIHIIPSLNSGGAESMLYKLSENSSEDNDIEIVTLLSGGFYAEQIKELGIPIHELNLTQKKQSVKSLAKLLKILNNADIIQSWMYHSDLIAFIFGKLLLRKKVIWSIRRSYLEKEYMKKGTYHTAKICSRLSKYVDGIISCTIVGKESHKKFGYKNQNFAVISNGFDLEEFDNTNLAIPEPYEGFKFLNVARWEPLKDHQTLFIAARILKEKGIQFILQLVGNGIDEHNKNLIDMIAKYDLDKEIQLLGVRDDIPELMRTSDIYVSSSLSEGFPNVIGEAMASGLYCVATDAGDTAYIVNDYGTVVPIQNPEKLAEGILHAINMGEDNLKAVKLQARKRIEEEFSIQRIVKQYEAIYQKIGNN